MQSHFYWPLCALLIVTCVSGEKDLKHYIQSRLDYVNEQLASTQDNSRSPGVAKDLDFHAETSKIVADQFQLVQVSKDLLLIDQVVFSIRSNGDLDVHHNCTEQYTFLKFFDYGNLRLTFAASNNSQFNIYIENNTLIQTVTYSHPISDAVMFEKKGNIFLIVSSWNLNSKSPLTLYKWAGAYFDEIQELSISGAFALEHFSGSLSTEIIIVLRNMQLAKAASYVYEFNDDKLRKVQVLPPANPKQSIAFQSQSQQFVFIFDHSDKSIAYLWKNEELVRYEIFENIPDVRKVINESSKSIPLIFVANKHTVYVYTVDDSIELLNSRTFPDMEIVELSLIENSLVIFASENSSLKEIIIPFDLRLSEIVSQVATTDILGSCLNELGEALKINDEEIAHTIILKYDENQNKSVLGASNQEITKMDDFEGIVENLERRLNELESTFSTLLQENLVIEGKLIIEGNLLVRNLEATNIMTKHLNGMNWTPDQWLSYSKNQGISGDVKIINLTVINAEVNHPNSIFNDMLLLSGNQKLKGGKLRNLKAGNVTVAEVNGIQMGDIYLRSHPVVIKGNKTFPELHVDELKTEMINKRNVSDVIKLFGDPKAVNYEFASKLTIDDLIVEKVNNVDWKEFESSAFRIGRDQTIRGNLTIARVKTHDLSAKRLAGIEINNLFTVNTPQTIHSTLHFRNIQVPNVITDKVNGLNLKEEVATFGNNTIKSPITIKNIEITKYLHLNQSIDKSSNYYMDNPSISKNKKDFQIYSGKVTIMGDVYLKNLNLETAKLHVAGNEFNKDQFQQYWLKNTTQEIPVRFEALQGITAPHLSTEFLNTVPIRNYMVNDAEENGPTKYIFENATVTGNIIIDYNFQHTPDLLALSEKAVKLEGTYEIQGKKVFADRIQVDDLKVDQINDLNIANLPSAINPQITGTKIFNNMIVSGDVNCKNLLTNKLNDATMDQLFGRMLFTDVPTTKDNLNFYNATADNLYATNINNKLFNEYVVQVNQIYVMDTMNRVIVKGNSTLKNVNQVVSINNINVIEKFENGRKSNVLKGNVTFDGRIHVKNLYLVNVNGINFENLLPRLYYRHWPQNVTARHSFGVVTTQNIITPRINDIYISQLFDVSSLEPQTLRVQHGLQITSPKFLKSLYANFGLCDFSNAIWSITNIPTRFWNSIQINGETTIYDGDSKIMDLLNNAVMKNKPATITAPVHFNHISTENLFTAKPLNGVELKDIFEDAVMNSIPYTDQVITGHKEFISLKSGGATVFGNAQIPIVNSLEINKINSSILRDFKTPVRGRKTFFGGLQAKSLYSKLVSGILPDNIVTLSDLRIIPNASFDSLEIINDFNVSIVQKQNFNKFLDDRLLVNSEEDQVVSAIYFLEEIQLNGPTRIVAINDILLEDVVFDEGSQVITGPKTLMTNLFLHGDVLVDKVNGFRLEDMHRLSIKLSEATDISGNLRFDGYSEINANVAAQSINGVPIDALKEMLETQNPQIRADIVQDTVAKIQHVVDENIEIIKRLPDQYLYLERSDKLQIDLANAVDAQPLKNEDSVMMHIKSEEPGNKCGLPEACLCSGQHTMQITPGYSKNVIENKYGQRVFSYRNEVIFVHVMTNSVSSGEDCRTNGSSLYEYTTLTWTVAPVGSRNGSSHVYQNMITGYISDVKFFTSGGQVYIVLSRFYDPIINSHDLFCQVLRLSKEMDQVEDVQRIPTKAAWTLHIFYTAQGINLIIGNKEYTDYNNGDLSTGIYRFNPDKKLFYLLRTIPIPGCTSAASVVLGYDSLIILAHRKTPLQVWKYYSAFENYYLYQSIVFEHPVSSVSTFYTGGAGISDAYLTAVTDNNHFYVYSYQYLAGWKLESEGEIDGLKALVPFRLNYEQLLFAPSITKSSILTVVKHGH
ncbi:PREDICTED: uncharacterized protein LOC108568764 [Nicrophorus vespilloides]|uniref:Uncharacterized protein LOC108568764 n=1 Tax=Nicrophorus vespilloides TaxID=110193 RepID=A0ABM1NFD2_NICVS|nr:PREDICTED: uncharacterized protein LOC108568764 [Nicrophorus vespilloides]